MESSRRNGEPRLKIIANLGRVDQLKDSGVLNRLAKNFSSYASDSILLDRSEATRSTRIPCEPFYDLIVSQVALKFGFAAKYPSLFDTAENGRQALEAIGAILFRMTGRVGTDLSQALTRVSASVEQGILPVAQPRIDPGEIHIFILPNSTSEASLSPLRGSITATISDCAGRVLSCTNWPGSVPLPEVVRQQIGRVKVAYPQSKPLVVLERKLVNNQLLALLTKKNVRFVAPLREAATTLDRQSARFLEERLEFSPLRGIEPLRFFRSVDGRVASIEAQIRDLQLAQIDAMRRANVGDPQSHAKTRSQISESSRWDGTTLIASNTDGQIDHVIDAYLRARHARRFQEYSNAYLSDMASHIDFPRAAGPLILGFVNAQAVAGTFASFVTDAVERETGRAVTWVDIVELLKNRAPFIVGENLSGPIAFPADEPVFDALLSSLDLDVSDIVAGLQSSLRNLDRGRG